MMASISMSVTGDWYVTVRTLTELPIIISKPPQFEAPKDSRYAWLNDALFVCQPEWVKGFNGIVLNVWKVK